MKVRFLKHDYFEALSSLLFLLQVDQHTEKNIKTQLQFLSLCRTRTDLNKSLSKSMLLILFSN